MLKILKTFSVYLLKFFGACMTQLDLVCYFLLNLQIAIKYFCTGNNN